MIKIFIQIIIAKIKVNMLLSSVSPRPQPCLEHTNLKNIILLSLAQGGPQSLNHSRFINVCDFSTDAFFDCILSLAKSLFVKICIQCKIWNTKCIKFKIKFFFKYSNDIHYKEAAESPPCSCYLHVLRPLVILRCQIQGMAGSGREEITVS